MHLVDPKGLEPLVFSLWVNCVNQFTLRVINLSRWVDSNHQSSAWKADALTIMLHLQLFELFLIWLLLTFLTKKLLYFRTGGWIRTTNNLFRRQMHYPLCYTCNCGTNRNWTCISWSSAKHTTIVLSFQNNLCYEPHTHSFCVISNTIISPKIMLFNKLLNIWNTLKYTEY